MSKRRDVDIEDDGEREDEDLREGEDEDTDDGDDDGDEEDPAEKKAMARRKKSVTPAAEETVTYIDFDSLRNHIREDVKQAIRAEVVKALGDLRKSVAVMQGQIEEQFTLTKALDAKIGEQPIVKAAAAQTPATEEAQTAAPTQAVKPEGEIVSKGMTGGIETKPATAAGLSAEEAQEALQLKKAAMDYQQQTGERCPGLNYDVISDINSGKLTRAQLDGLRKGVESLNLKK